MRAILERSCLARGAIVALAALAVLALVRVASAGDDLGLRRATFWPEPQTVSPLVDVPDGSAPRHRQARRIWAASRGRPLRITLGHAARLARVAATGPHPRRSVSIARGSVASSVIAPRFTVVPKPPRPALVSIYQDRTLREGDAVMMEDGIHVFHGVGVWPFRTRDFVRLASAATLDWRLRQTLNDLDRNPPTRWSSMGSTAG